MAIVTGHELAVQIHEIRPNLPIIFISAYPEIAEHRPPGLRHLEFVSKPFTSLKLVSKIREVRRVGRVDNDRHCEDNEHLYAAVQMPSSQID